MKNAREGEEIVVDVELCGSMKPRGSLGSESLRSPPLRDPLGPPMVGVVSQLAANERCPEPAEGRPDPEVPVKARRRRFSAQYKKKILEEADACKGKPGAVGALLRREGLYSSHLATWRKQREKAELDGLAPKKRGRKAKPVNPLARKASLMV